MHQIDYLLMVFLLPVLFLHKKHNYFRRKNAKKKNGVQHTLYAILPQAQHKTAHSFTVSGNSINDTATIRTNVHIADVLTIQIHTTRTTTHFE